MQNRGRPPPEDRNRPVSARFASFAPRFRPKSRKRFFDSFILSLACPTFRPGCEGSVPNPVAFPASRSKNRAVLRSLRSQVSDGFVVAANRNGRRIRNRSSCLLFDSCLRFDSGTQWSCSAFVLLRAWRYFGPCDSSLVGFSSSLICSLYIFD